MVESYIVDCISDVEEFKEEVESSVTSFEFKPQGTKYTCSVVARNADGDGPAGVAHFTAG